MLVHTCDCILLYNKNVTFALAAKFLATSWFLRLCCNVLIIGSWQMRPGKHWSILLHQIFFILSIKIHIQYIKWSQKILQSSWSTILEVNTRNKPLHFCVHSNFISISLMLQWVAFTNSNIVQSFMSPSTHLTETSQLTCETE